MAEHAGILWTSVALLAAAILFFLLSVAGAFWPKPTPLSDLGLYAVTIILLGFGLGGLLLRWAKMNPGASS